jgi:hypothetical protein
MAGYKLEHLAVLAFWAFSNTLHWMCSVTHMISKPFGNLPGNARGLIVVVLLTGLVHTASNTDGNDLWERMVVAKGGRARLRAGHSRVVSTSVEGGVSRPDIAPNVRMERVLELPDRQWLWVDHRPGTFGFTTLVWNRTSRDSWRSDNGQNPGPSDWGTGEEHDTKLDIEQIQALYLLETAFVSPKTVTLVNRNKDTALLEVVVANHTLRYTVDLKTSLAKRVTSVPWLGDAHGNGPYFPSATLVFSYELEGVVDIDGLRMPRRLTLLCHLRSL